MDGKDGSKRYILLTELSEDLEEWISTGKTETLEFKALPEEKEREFRSMSERYGYTVAIGRQKMSFMNHEAEIVYLHIIEPKSGVGVALIPWFMLPRKKYPVFAYVYADCYRQEHKAGTRETAKATADLFGVGMHYSTVSRIKGLGLTLFGTNNEMATEKTAPVSLDEVITTVHGILSEAANSGRQRAKRERSVPSIAPAVRKRKREPRCPAVCRTGGATNTKFVGRPRLNDDAKRFISLCRNYVMIAATQNHRFLL